MRLPIRKQHIDKKTGKYKEEHAYKVQCSIKRLISYDTLISIKQSKMPAWSDVKFKILQ